MTASPPPAAEPPQHAAAAEDADLGLHDPLARSFPDTLEGKLLFVIAIVFSLFQLATAAHVVDMPSQLVRSFHVGFLMLLGLPLLAAARHRPTLVHAAAWL
ncbi:MAG: TRAP transporter permease, partial [Hyphomicrobiaceae bacterium]